MSGNDDASCLRHGLRKRGECQQQSVISSCEKIKLTILLDDESADSENSNVASEHETVLTSSNDENGRVFFLELCLLLASIEPVVGRFVKTVFSSERSTSVRVRFVTFDLPQSGLIVDKIESQV